MSEAEDLQFKETFPLVIGLLAGLAIFFVVIALVVANFYTEDTYAPPGMSRAEAIAARVQPVGEVNMGGPVVAAADTGGSGAAEEAAGEPQSGSEVYSAVCGACHDAGVAGAPKTDDTAAWKQRLDARGGYDALYQNALNGRGAMPAKGGANISEEELDRAVKYMLDESGVSL